MRSERCCAIARHLMSLIQNGLMTHSGKNHTNRILNIQISIFYF
jgi:hypothetical protein